MSITSNLPRSVENLTDSQLEMYRRLLVSKIARLDRDRIVLAAQENEARRDLDEVEQEQQNRLADKAGEQHRSSRR